MAASLTQRQQEPRGVVRSYSALAAFPLGRRCDLLHRERRDVSVTAALREPDSPWNRAPLVLTSGVHYKLTDLLRASVNKRLELQSRQKEPSKEIGLKDVLPG